MTENTSATEGHIGISVVVPSLNQGRFIDEASPQLLSDQLGDIHAALSDEKVAPNSTC